MKPNQQKIKFIELRAEGKSYAFISKELQISKATCSSWEKELTEEISRLKAEELTGLYDAYHMTREARIKKIGGTLARINEALDNADLSELPAEKLLEFKLKYEEALKAEYIPVMQATPLKENYTEHDILNALGNLLHRVQSGTTPREQASNELAVFNNILKAYENVEIKAKMDALEALIGER